MSCVSLRRRKRKSFKRLSPLVRESKCSSCRCDCRSRTVKGVRVLKDVKERDREEEERFLPSRSSLGIRRRPPSQKGGTRRFPPSPAISSPTDAGERESWQTSPRRPPSLVALARPSQTDTIAWLCVFSRARNQHRFLEILPISHMVSRDRLQHCFVCSGGQRSKLSPTESSVGPIQEQGDAQGRGP